MYIYSLKACKCLCKIVPQKDTNILLLKFQCFAASFSRQNYNQETKSKCNKLKGRQTKAKGLKFEISKKKLSEFC